MTKTDTNNQRDIQTNRKTTEETNNMKIRQTDTQIQGDRKRDKKTDRMPL